MVVFVLECGRWDHWIDGVYRTEQAAKDAAPPDLVWSDGGDAIDSDYYDYTIREYEVEG